VRSLESPGGSCNSGQASGNLCNAPDPEWEICTLCVRSDYRNQSLNRPVLEDIISDVQRNGGKRLAANYSEKETFGRANVSSLSTSDCAIILLKNDVTHTRPV
jgi:hypothetical protein